MSAPQTKEGPASLLRAMFAGFGSLMSVMDKVRGKSAAKAPSDAEAAAPAPVVTETPAQESAAAETAAPETAVPDAAAPEAAAPETAAPEATAPEAAETEAIAAEATAVEATAAEPEAAAEPAAVVETAPEPASTVQPEAVAAETPAAAESTVTETTAEAGEASDAGALPLPNYEGLTVASLRARLRNLTNDDLNQLMAYEKAHQNRPEVVKMFQNRLIKMTTGMPKLES